MSKRRMLFMKNKNDNPNHPNEVKINVTYTKESLESLEYLADLVLEESVTFPDLIDWFYNQKLEVEEPESNIVESNIADSDKVEKSVVMTKEQLRKLDSLCNKFSFSRASLLYNLVYSEIH